MNYYIADLHFGHVNGMAYDNRPFATIQDNDKVLIENWNDTVGYEDDVYILGDVSWHNVTKTIEIIKQLNGNKHLIIGNHDGRLLKNGQFRSLFVEIAHYKELRDGNRTVVLSHYPIVWFNGHFHGNVHLYGHVHRTAEYNMVEKTKNTMIDLQQRPCLMYNVGCMMSYMRYRPCTLREAMDTETNEFNKRYTKDEQVQRPV